MQNSNQKEVRVNLVGRINNHYDNIEDEQRDILMDLLRRLNEPRNIMVPGDIFITHLPGNRIDFYLVFKDIYMFNQQEYYQNPNSKPPKLRLDYSHRELYRVYDPNNRDSLFDLENEIIEDLKYDYSIELGDVIEVNIGGQEGQRPTKVYYNVIKNVLNVDYMDARRARWIRSNIKSELEAEDTSQIRGGSQLKLKPVISRRGRRKKKTQRKRKRNKKTKKRKIK